MIKFPKHVELRINHNPQVINNETVAEYLRIEEVEDCDFINSDDEAVAIKNNSLWVIQWYPSNPVGFYWAYGATFETALNKANEINREVYG